MEVLYSGHGGSTACEADLWATADLLAQLGPASYVGYSMGARMVLHTAVAHPELVARMVLVSGTAGIEDPDERAQRRAADEALADRIEAIGVPAFLDEWLALPLFAHLPPDAHDRAERERNTAAGLASSLRLAGTGTQRPLWDRLGGVQAPTLVVTGHLDAKFDQLGDRLAANLPSAERLRLRGGHTVHREDPDAPTRLAAWLAAP